MVGLIGSYFAYSFSIIPIYGKIDHCKLIYLHVSRSYMIKLTW